jgi:hypothetical protein
VGSSYNSSSVLQALFTSAGLPVTFSNLLLHMVKYKFLKITSIQGKPLVVEIAIKARRQKLMNRKQRLSEVKKWLKANK